MSAHDDMKVKKDRKKRKNKGAEAAFTRASATILLIPLTFSLAIFTSLALSPLFQELFGLSWQFIVYYLRRLGFIVPPEMQFTPVIS